MYKILYADIHPSPFGEQTVWYIEKDNHFYYISYQSKLPVLEKNTSEAMAFECDINGEPFDWTEKAMCRGYSPDESFVKIIEQLQFI